MFCGFWWTFVWVYKKAGIAGLENTFEQVLKKKNNIKEQPCRATFSCLSLFEEASERIEMLICKGQYKG